MREARAHLSRLVKDAMAGEEIIIARRGRPIARLAPFTPPEKPRVFGRMRGKIGISDDFDAPLSDDVFAAFQGEPLGGRTVSLRSPAAGN
jgi:prevent-host-death family protein